MTSPAPWKRTTAAERRQQRAEFKALKERVAAAPSAKTAAYQAHNRHSDLRGTARVKVRKALAGGAPEPFTAMQLSKVTPAELGMLKKEAANRMGQLTAEERAAFRQNSWLVVLSLTVEQLRAIAAQKAI